MFGRKEKRHLESYIIWLLMDDKFREIHKQKLQDWIKQSEAPDAHMLGFLGHKVVMNMAENLADNGSLLVAEKLLWNYKTDANKEL